jgi:hypothetical protein
MFGVVQAIHSAFGFDDVPIIADRIEAMGQTVRVQATTDSLKTPDEATTVD